MAKAGPHRMQASMPVLCNAVIFFVSYASEMSRKQEAPTATFRTGLQTGLGYCQKMKDFSYHTLKLCGGASPCQKPPHGILYSNLRILRQLRLHFIATAEHPTYTGIPGSSCSDPSA